MAQLKEIRTRIASVKNTKQVTSAMKMVSAAKLKKAQDAILQIQPYDKKLTEIIQNLSLGELKFESTYFTEAEELENVLLIVVGANRGLCGAFNANVAKMALNHAIENYNPQLKAGKVTFLPIGKQVQKELRIRGAETEHEANDLINDHDFDTIANTANDFMAMFNANKFQRIDLVYNKFKNAAVQELTAEQFLPVGKPKQDDANSVAPDYIYEPGQEEILTSVIPKSLRMRLYRVLIDSNAAEQGARMTAMHQATDNATELLKDLKTKYNNARQATITNEILEIVSGAEALKG